MKLGWRVILVGLSVLVSMAMAAHIVEEGEEEGPIMEERPVIEEGPKIPMEEERPTKPFRDPIVVQQPKQQIMDPTPEEGAKKPFRDPIVVEQPSQKMRDPTLEEGAKKPFRDPDVVVQEENERPSPKETIGGDLEPTEFNQVVHRRPNTSIPPPGPIHRIRQQSTRDPDEGEVRNSYRVTRNNYNGRVEYDGLSSEIPQQPQVAPRTRTSYSITPQGSRTTTYTTSSSPGGQGSQFTRVINTQSGGDRRNFVSAAQLPPKNQRAFQVHTTPITRTSSGTWTSDPTDSGFSSSQSSFNNYDSSPPVTRTSSWSSPDGSRFGSSSSYTSSSGSHTYNDGRNPPVTTRWGSSPVGSGFHPGSSWSGVDHSSFMDSYSGDIDAFGSSGLSDNIDDFDMDAIIPTFSANDLGSIFPGKEFTPEEVKTINDLVKEIAKDYLKASTGRNEKPLAAKIEELPDDAVGLPSEDTDVSNDAEEPTSAAIEDIDDDDVTVTPENGEDGQPGKAPPAPQSPQPASGPQSTKPKPNSQPPPPSQPSLALVHRPRGSPLIIPPRHGSPGKIVRVVRRITRGH